MKQPLYLSLVFSLAGLLACSSSDSKKAAPASEVEYEMSVKSDQDQLQKLRSEIPEEIRKSNDRLAEVLKRWKIIKTPPSELREKFDDEIRKERGELEKNLSRRRQDFDRAVADKRKDFQDKQKEERDDFYSSKPKSDKRQDFNNKQSIARDRFNSDLRDERDRFEDEIKEQRKDFESKIADKRTEFKQEFPEYTDLYNQMKKEEEKQKEFEKNNPKPYTGWPYKADGESSAISGPTSGQMGSTGSAVKANDPSRQDVNKGGNGWPSTDPTELNQVPNPPKGGN